MRKYLNTAMLFILTATAVGLCTVRVKAQSLDGTWEIMTVIDNGRVVQPNEVLMNYAADGRVVIRGQQVELVVPVTFQRKQLPFIADPSQNPMTFDLAGAEKTGGRGILMTSNDSLLLCLSGRDQPRPTSFSSLPGSGNLLVTLRRVAANAPAPAQPQAAPSYQDEQLKQMLVGTWGHQNAESVHYITLAASGTVNIRTTWKEQFKQLFHQEVRSSGKWQVQNGVVTISIDTSTDAERRGQTGSFRVRSITGNEMTAVDYEGNVRQEWKAPQQ
jgi:uncharacterized protein (TIGR03067 family)